MSGKLNTARSALISQVISVLLNLSVAHKNEAGDQDVDLGKISYMTACLSKRV